MYISNESDKHRAVRAFRTRQRKKRELKEFLIMMSAIILLIIGIKFLLML